MASFSPVLWLCALSCAVFPAFSDEHSLFYTYTALSKPLQLPGIYEFTALGMLDDRELDYYTSETQAKIPKQDWMREKMPQDYWVKGTQSRKSKEQWFKVNVDILMDRMRHNKSDLHVLQWRHGCVIKNGEDRQVEFVRGVDEYSYDGSEFLSFDDVNSRWIAPVQAAVPTKMKWDQVLILNQYTKGYLEKECVEWLTKFMGYGEAELKKHSPPDVRMFAKKSVANPDKLTLTCMATGFYPKDIQMSLRKYRTALPEHLVTSLGVRPNGDGTYQLRKSVEITPEDKALYNCYVNHITLKEPININPRDEIPCFDCTVPKIQSGIIGGVFGVVLTLAAIAVILVILKKKGIITLGSPQNFNANMLLPVIQPLLNGNAKTPAQTPNAASPQMIQPLLNGNAKTPAQTPNAASPQMIQPLLNGNAKTPAQTPNAASPQMIQPLLNGNAKTPAQTPNAASPQMIQPLLNGNAKTPAQTPNAASPQMIQPLLNGNAKTPAQTPNAASPQTTTDEDKSSDSATTDEDKSSDSATTDEDKSSDSATTDEDKSSDSVIQPLLNGNAKTPAQTPNAASPQMIQPLLNGNAKTPAQTPNAASPQMIQPLLNGNAKTPAQTPNAASPQMIQPLLNGNAKTPAQTPNAASPQRMNSLGSQEHV